MSRPRGWSLSRCRCCFFFIKIGEGQRCIISHECGGEEENQQFCLHTVLAQSSVCRDISEIVIRPQIWIWRCAAAETVTTATSPSTALIFADVCPFFITWLKWANNYPASLWLQSGIGSWLSSRCTTSLCQQSVPSNQWGTSTSNREAISEELKHILSVLRVHPRHSYQFSWTFTFLSFVCALLSRGWSCGCEAIL